MKFTKQDINREKIKHWMITCPNQYSHNKTKIMLLIMYRIILKQVENGPKEAVQAEFNFRKF